MLSLAASHAATWSVCKAQPGFVLQLVQQGRIAAHTDTIWNVEGVNAHSVGEAILKGLPIPTFATRDMIEYGGYYADLCNEIMQDGGQRFIEMRVPLWYMPGRKGLVDFGAVTPEAIEVVDYKYGAGKKVSAFENKQMAIYARGLINSLEATGLYEFADSQLVRLTINQPRIDGEDVPWELTWGELKAFTEEHITAPAVEILADPFSPKLPFAPSDKVCQFCPAESHCAARMKWLISDVDCFKPLLKPNPPEVLDLPELTALTPEQFSAILKNRKAIEKYLDTANKMGMSLARCGKTPLGMKVVPGNNYRHWKDEEEAKRLLLQKLTRNQVVAEEIMSPAQAEKALKMVPDLSTKYQNLIDAQVEFKPRNDLLVPLSDKRVSVEIDPKTEFQDLTKLEGLTGYTLEAMEEIAEDHFGAGKPNH